MTHGIVKIHKLGDVPFTQIPNELIRDSAITSNAVRLYAYLASHSDGYDLAYQQIERQTDLGEHAIRQAIKLLVSAGWLKTERQRTAGKLGKYDFYVYASRLDYSKVESFQGGTITPHIEEHLIKKNTNNKKAAVETALPADWKPSEQLLGKFATDWPNVNKTLEIKKFLDYWHDDPTAKKKNWNQAFTNWMYRAEENAQKRAMPFTKPKTREEETMEQLQKDYLR